MFDPITTLMWDYLAKVFSRNNLSIVLFLD